MKIHAEIELLLYDYIAGDLSPAERRNVEEHISVCRECLREYEDLKSFNELSRAGGRIPSDQLPPEYWNEFAARVERRVNALEKKPAHTREKWWEPITSFVLYRPRFAMAAAAAVTLLLVAVSLLIVRQDNLPEQNNIDIPALVTHPVNVDDRVGQYLKKSKVLLVGLSNMDGTEAPEGDWGAEHTVSLQLVNEARYLQQQPIDFQAARLIRDLAKIQADIASVSENKDEDALRMIRQNIHRDNLLFKVRMAESVYGDARFASTTGNRGWK